MIYGTVQQRQSTPGGPNPQWDDDTHVLAHAGLAQKLEEFQFAQRSETEHGMIERSDLLDGDFTPARTVYRGANDAVGAFTDDIEDLILCT